LEKGLEVNEKRDNMNIEEMVFDLIPEDARDIFRKRTALQWDRKKKKYVQQSGGMDPTGALRGTLRSESGHSIKHSKAKEGKVYEEWQKRSKKSIAKVGEVEGGSAYTAFQDDKVQSRYRYKAARANQGEQNHGARDELKTQDQIKKARHEKDHRKTKQGGVKRPRENESNSPRPNKRFKRSAHNHTRSKAIVKRK
jgi:hypothetical protein